MPHSFRIYFDDEPRIDNVVVAIAPIDAFSGRMVTSGVHSRIEGLADVPRRNLSGMLVFVNLPAQAEYRVMVSAGEAGYFDPAPMIYMPPEHEDPEVARKRRLDVPLYRLPSTSIDSDATHVAGLLVRGQQPVPGAIVRAQLPESESLAVADPTRPFETRTDERGAFTLPLRLPHEEADEPALVTFTFRDGGDEREIERSVLEGKLNSFEEPIDLAGTNVPQILAFAN